MEKIHGFCVQVRIGDRHEVERNTNISMCQQLQQSASLSDDELEYAADSAASPSSDDAPSDVNGAATKQHPAQTADGHGERASNSLRCSAVTGTRAIATERSLMPCLGPGQVPQAQAACNPEQLGKRAEQTS